jgi:hypothetical protein
MASVFAVVADEQVEAWVRIRAHRWEALASGRLDADTETVITNAVEVLDGGAGLFLCLELNETDGTLVGQDFDSDDVSVHREERSELGRCREVMKTLEHAHGWPLRINHNLLRLGNFMSCRSTETRGTTVRQSRKRPRADSMSAEGRTDLILNRHRSDGVTSVHLLRGGLVAKQRGIMWACGKCGRRLMLSRDDAGRGNAVLDRVLCDGRVQIGLAEEIVGPRRIARDIELTQMRVGCRNAVATAVDVLALETRLRILCGFNIAHLRKDNDGTFAAQGLANGNLLESIAHELLTHF